MKRQILRRRREKALKHVIAAECKTREEAGGYGNGKRNIFCGINRGRGSDEEAARVETDAAKLSGGRAATSWGTEEDAVFAGTSLPWPLQ
jgi:hypothetical protein